ncbi:MAG TPA: hypothetical protein VF549_11050 [Solirubrobacteraceae bacterium]|jgi:hypothetical protein
MRRALLITAVLLAGCGSPERSPEEVARNYVASDDPDKCDKDADIAFLESQTHKKDEAAREECRRNVERSEPPKSVRVLESKVDGNRAVVELEASGQRIRVLLRRLGGYWRVTGFR